MSDPLKRFLDLAQENNVDDKLIESPTIQHALKKCEQIGENLGESAINKIKKTPLKPSSPTPTFQESAFVKPKKETTLYNVTTQENKLPIITKASKLFKKASYSVRGLTGAATHKTNEQSYSLLLGERVGFNITKSASSCKSGFNANYKVSNKKTSLEYFSKNPVNNYSITVFNQESNFGITGHYSNNRGVSASLSIDKNSTSAECSYNKKKQMCNMEFGAYVTSGENYSNPFAGIRGRVTF